MRGVFCVLMTNHKKQLDALTGLRFVAAFVVFVHHLGGKFGFGMNGYSIGSLAVTFFFVLSGFILTYVYHDRLQSSGDLKRFFFNRFARIWPLHVVCLFIAAGVVSKGHIGTEIGGENMPMFFTNLFLLQSWVPYNDWVFSFNGVSWSISTEAFFYLVFPLLALGGIQRIGRKVAVSLLVVMIAVFTLNKMSQMNMWGWDYYRVGHVNPLVRLPEFCFGVLAGKLFLLRHSKASKNIFWLDTVKEILCLGSIVGAAVLVSGYKVQFPIAEAKWGSQFLASWFRVTYPAILFAITVFVFSTSRGAIARICSFRPMVYLGDISYAFYMIHFLVLRQVNAAYLSYGKLEGYEIALLAFGLAVAMSILLFELVEMPAKNFLRRLFYGRPKASSKLAFLPYSLIGKLVLAGMLLIGCSFVLKINATDLQRNRETNRVFQISDPKTRFVEFGSQFRLQGCNVVKEEKRLKLQMVWVKRIEAKRMNFEFPYVSQKPTRFRRLVFVLDKNGKQIARGMHNQKPFTSAMVGKEFQDEVLIPYSKLRNAAYVVVCFREKGYPGLIANRGERLQRGKQLVLLNQQDIKKLLR